MRPRYAARPGASIFGCGFPRTQRAQADDARTDTGGTAGRRSCPDRHAFQAESARRRRLSACGTCRELAFPRQSMRDDDPQVVEAWLPAQGGARPVGRRDDLGGVSGAPAGKLDLEIDAGHALHVLDHLQHRVAPAVSAVEGRRRAAAAQIGQGIGMCAHQIRHVDVVTDAGAIRGGVVGAEDVHFGPQAERRLNRDLDQVGRPPGRLPGTAERVGAGDIEVAQDQVAQAVGGTRVSQHDLRHQLRGTVGRHRHGGIVFLHRHTRRIAVHGSSRGEDEMGHPALDGSLDQGARAHRVVPVIAERVCDRVRHDDRGGEMNDGIHSVLGDHGLHHRLIAGLPDQQRDALRQCPIESGREIVEHDHALAAVDERVDHVTSDIAGAAGDQDCHAGNRGSLHRGEGGFGGIGSRRVPGQSARGPSLMRDGFQSNWMKIPLAERCTPVTTQGTPS